jgi:Ni,Fe-hydrogenase maturation factor
LGKKLGLALPQRIIIFAIEIEDDSTFSEQCTPEVKKSFPAIVDMVIRELDSA